MNELDTLKERADKLGISYHPSIGVDKLREKVNSKLNGDTEANTEEPEKEAPSEVQLSEEEAAKKEASKLVRVNVTCMNPNKREWTGEIFTVSNRLGRWRKLVPFNTENGYHIPNIIFQMLKSKQCQIFVKGRDSKGRDVVTPKLVKEFAIDVLPALTEEELKKLASEQAARGSID